MVLGPLQELWIVTIQHHHRGAEEREGGRGRDEVGAGVHDRKGVTRMKLGRGGGPRDDVTGAADRPGETVELTIWRGGETSTLGLVLAP